VKEKHFFLKSFKVETLPMGRTEKTMLHYSEPYDFGDSKKVGSKIRGKVNIQDRYKNLQLETAKEITNLCTPPCRACVVLWQFCSKQQKNFRG